MPGWILLVGLLVLPWVEFWIFLSLPVPAWMEVLWCTVTAVVGWWHARGEDLTLWSELEADVRNRRVPTDEGIEAMLRLAGAWGLIIPGLLTDVLGAALLLPKVREKLVGPIRGLIRSRL